MQNNLNRVRQLVVGAVEVPAGTLKTAPLILTLSPQLPILVDLKIMLNPLGLAMEKIGFQIHAGMGQTIFPAMGSNNGATLAASSVWSPIPNVTPLDTGELNIQIPGAPYDLEFNFFNESASNVFVFIWARVTAKIDLPVAPIQDDKLEKKEKEKN